MKIESMDQRSTCPSCQANWLAPFGARGAFTLARCQSCGLVFVREKVPNGFIEKFYDGRSCDAHTKDDQELRRRISDRLDHVGELKLSGRRALDVGCGPGLFMDEAQKRGFDCVGIDADAQRVEYCRQRGLNVVHGLLPHPEVPEGSFDLVWLSHVIEHVPNPPQFIAQLARMLRPDGLLCILTPNIQSLAVRVCRSHHRFVIPPEHLTYWSKASLLRAMKTAGFATETVYAGGGGLQLKEILAYVLKLQFLREPAELPPVARFADGKGRSARTSYDVLMKLDRLAAPVIGRLGGSELRGIFRKRAAA